MTGETHYVYVFARVVDNVLTAPVKVGISKDVVRRLSNIQTASPFPVKIAYVFAMPDSRVAREVERAFHETQKSNRAHGEWFDYDPIRAIHILCICLRALLNTTITDGALIQASLELSGVLSAEKKFDLHIPGRSTH